MKNKILCELEYHKSRHLNQVYAGFEKLHRQNVIDLKVKKVDMVEGEDMIARVLVNNKHRVIYDTLDGFNWIKIEDEKLNLNQFSKLTGEVDYYFKRSFKSNLQEHVQAGCNYFPLGLNYNVIPDRKLIRDSIFHTLGRLREPKMVYRDILNYEIEHLTASAYEYSPTVNNKDKVLFLCRLWEYDMYNNAPMFQAQVAEINQSRINSIRACKEAFGERFIGGVYDDPASQKFAPDLIVSSEYTHKLNFLDLIKASNICIATTGLHNSIGWKMGEYVAASRAVISEPLHFELPGEFTEGNNYLEFHNTEELVSKVDTLLSDRNKLQDMMDSNFEYYKEFVKPDNMILNSLRKVLSLDHIIFDKNSINNVS
jgi:hypothetical protein